MADITVRVALVHRVHAHHRIARDWFHAQGPANARVSVATFDHGFLALDVPTLILA